MRSEMPCESYQAVLLASQRSSQAGQVLPKGRPRPVAPAMRSSDRPVLPAARRKKALAPIPKPALPESQGGSGKGHCAVDAPLHSCPHRGVHGTRHLGGAHQCHGTAFHPVSASDAHPSSGNHWTLVFHRHLRRRGRRPLGVDRTVPPISRRCATDR